MEKGKKKKEKKFEVIKIVKFKNESFFVSRRHTEEDWPGKGKKRIVKRIILSYKKKRAKPR